MRFHIVILVFNTISYYAVEGERNNECERVKIYVNRSVIKMVGFVRYIVVTVHLHSCNAWQIVQVKKITQLETIIATGNAI